MDFHRKIIDSISNSFKKTSDVFHVLIGPRQVGKTTAAEQLIQKLKWPYVIASADGPTPPGPEWIEQQWHLATIKAKIATQPVLLVLDEIQKVKGWSEILKYLWDVNKPHRAKIRLLVLGSSALLVQKGLTESLAGRFFLHRAPHWSWKECQQAFGWSLDQWLYFGGYPGAAVFADNQNQWKQYVKDSLIESVLSRDVLQMQPINKPALLRHLFLLSATFPAQILSYNKMLGQLQDAGNTTTLANYLWLLEQAFLVSGLEMFSQGHIRKRGSSPKLILWNNALVNALSLKSFDEAQADRLWWGRLVENAVGAHLLNQLNPVDWIVSYWRQGDLEVDFVVQHGQEVWAIEVKSGKGQNQAGLTAFKKQYPKAKTLVIGSDGIPLEEFFANLPERFF